MFYAIDVCVSLSVCMCACVCGIVYMCLCYVLFLFACSMCLPCVSHECFLCTVCVCHANPVCAGSLGDDSGPDGAGEDHAAEMSPVLRESPRTTGEGDLQTSHHNNI